MIAPISLPPIPSVETERLVLRGPIWSDFEAYAAYRASPRSKTVGGPFSRGQAFDGFCALVGHWAYRGFGRWIIADRTTDQPLGVAGLFEPEDWPEPEIAWTVFDGAEGKGIAYEAALASRRFAYDTLGWTTVVSLVDPTNTRSVALAQRMGCTPDGVHSHPTYGDLTIWRHLSQEALRD